MEKVQSAMWENRLRRLCPERVLMSKTKYAILEDILQAEGSHLPKIAVYLHSKIYSQFI